MSRNLAFRPGKRPLTDAGSVLVSADTALPPGLRTVMMTVGQTLPCETSRHIRVH
jgi:hypothetical protein